jgi:fido (protein-threonine AMPylation protein)
VQLNKRLAAALETLKQLQDDRVVAIHTDQIKSVKHRQLLLKYGFIREASRGWYIASNPNEKVGETTSWFSAFWDFIPVYLDRKYGENWCLSADQSLFLHAQNFGIPPQLLVRSPQANNKPTPMLHGTSVFNLKMEIPPKALTVQINGIRMYSLSAALIYASPGIFATHALEVRTILSMVPDASELLHTLLEKGHSTIAGRLAGAFRKVGKHLIADDIIAAFKHEDFDIREADPFASDAEVKLAIPSLSPLGVRLQLMWQEMRETVLKYFPVPSGKVTDIDTYLEHIDEVFVLDAYHSLSIERYLVSPELIKRVSSGTWDTDKNDYDQRERDAMAARGYFQAYKRVKKSIRHILEGTNAGSQVAKDHGEWYRELFDPSVAAGLLRPADLAGYRNHRVFIGNSRHVPVQPEEMRNAMPVLFELLAAEPESAVRAVLGHFFFVYIHPYMDGNGRIARFLMNAMLASGGYPWTIVPVEQRDAYMEALEHASVEQNIESFARFLADLVMNK